MVPDIQNPHPDKPISLRRIQERNIVKHPVPHHLEKLSNEKDQKGLNRYGKQEYHNEVVVII